MENSYSIYVPIFKQFHKNIIGKGGANIKKVTAHASPLPALPRALPGAGLGFNVGAGGWCQLLSPPAVQIREESNTKIDLPAENSNSETIVITGKRANCEAARSRILSIQKDLVRGVGGQGPSSLPSIPQHREARTFFLFEGFFESKRQETADLKSAT